MRAMNEKDGFIKSEDIKIDRENWAEIGLYKDHDVFIVDLNEWTQEVGNKHRSGKKILEERHPAEEAALSRYNEILEGYKN